MTNPFGIRDDLIVPLDGIDIDPMLDSWRWLIPFDDRPLFATALGDLFLADPAGRVLWLDMGTGELLPVAADEPDFRRAVADPDNESLWFGAALVDRLRAGGKVLGPGECYCYLLLPLLGGGFEPNNFVMRDVVVHFQIWGPIHERLRDLPDGATIEFEVVE